MRPGRLKFFRGCGLSILTGFVLLGSTAAFGQAAADPWPILPGGEKGSINVHTTRRDLVRMYGAANVVDRDISLGEGETAPGTVIFPKDPQRAMEIVWKDPDKEAEPDSLTIRGCSSRWRTLHNVSLGASLKELEKLNGQQFHLAGFDWDYSGTITSWDNGALAAEFNGKHGRVIFRFSCSGAPTTEDEQSQVMGDRDFSSSHPVMQKINPGVGEIVWLFGPQSAP